MSRVSQAVGTSAVNTSYPVHHGLTAWAFAWILHAFRPEFWWPDASDAHIGVERRRGDHDAGFGLQVDPPHPDKPAVELKNRP
jgi:hypothetical protein